MKPFLAFVLAIAPFVAGLRCLDGAAAQAPSANEKINAYVGCINRLSERAYDSRSRYFSWAGKNGPTGKERIIYGTYTIYDTSDCRQERREGQCPRAARRRARSCRFRLLGGRGEARAAAKEADDYYSQQDYRDDRMAKGRALHPRLVAAWDAFASADKELGSGVEAINEKRAAVRLAEIERNEGRKARYHVEALMIHAKRVLRAEKSAKPDMPRSHRH